MKNKRLKIFLICLFSFLFISASVTGGVLLSGSSYSVPTSESAGGGFQDNENLTDDNNNVTINATEPTNSGFWTDSGNYDTTFAGGTGTESDPYLISTARQLAGLAYNVNNGTNYSGVYFLQTANIDLSAYWWTPIGSSSSIYFAGLYDGGKYTISGLFTQSGSESYSGLFGYTLGTSSSHAEITNVGIVDSNIQGRQYTGAVIGNANYTDISNCHNTGTVNTGDFVGGIVGYLYINSSISNCYNTGNISSSTSYANVGGIAGYAASAVTNSYNKGNITGSSSFSGTSNPGGVGGIVGWKSQGDISNTYNTGSISRGGYGTGGIVGYISAPYICNISNSYNIGTVYIAAMYHTSGYFLGGIIGYDGYGSSFSRCVNLGSVYYSATGGYYTTNVGEIIGGGGYLVRNCYYGNLGHTYGVRGSSGGTTLNCSTVSVDQFKTESFLSTLGWNSVWTINENINDGYPVLIGVGEGESLSFWTDEGNYDTDWEGSGTAGDPYQISTPQELAGLAYQVNSGNDYYSGEYFLQTANLDMSAHWWDPIGYVADGSGSNDTLFLGNYDGGNHTISNVFIIDVEKSDLGLFGIIDNNVAGTTNYIKNIKLDNVNISSSDSVYVGGLVGVIRGHSFDQSNGGSVGNWEISNVHVSGNLNVRNINGESGGQHENVMGTGGVVGYIDSASNVTISNCSFNGSILRQSNGITQYNSGGILGTLDRRTGLEMINCEVSGQIDGDVSYVGGILGGATLCYNGGNKVARISNCVNNATISGNEYVAGIIGRSTTYQNIIIEHCTNFGEVRGEYVVSGIFAMPEETKVHISNCANFGEISGRSNVSGILGELCTISNAYIDKCYNVGNITGISDNMGGIGGHFAGNSFIKDCYNTGNITTGANNIGGILGTNIGVCEIINCYNTGSVNGVSSVGGILGVVGEKNINTKVINCFNVGEVIYSGDQSGAIVGRVGHSSYSFSNNYYGGNCTLNYGIGTTMNDNGTSRDSNLVANAKSLDWYKDFSNWNGSSPWDFNSVWTLTSSQNDGYPILKNRNSIYVVYHFYGNNQVPLLVTSDNALVENGKLWNGDSSLIYSSIVSGEIELNFSVSNGEQNYRISINEEPTLESDLNSCTYVWNVQDDSILNVYVYQQKIIRYHSNNGTEETVEEFVIGTQNSIVSENLFTAMEGYHFSHWNTLENGNGTNYSVGQEVNFVSNVDLYAQWSGNIYKISFMINGELSSVYYFKYGVGLFANNPGDTPANPLISISPINRQGYTFYGYFTEPNGQGEMVVDENGWIVCSNTLFLEDSSIYAYLVPNVLAQFDEEGQYWYIEMGKMPQTKVTDILIINALNNDSTLDDNDGVTTSSNGYYFAGTILQAKIYNGNEYCYYYGSWYLVEPVKWRLDTPSATSGYISEDTLAVMTNIVYVGRYANHSLGLGEGYATVNDGSGYSFVVDYLNNFSAVDKEYLVEFTADVENFSVSNDSSTTISSNIFLSSNEELNNIFGSYSAEFSDLVKDYLKLNNINSMYFVRDLGSNLNNILCHTESGSTINQRPTNYLGMRFTIKVTEFVCI